MPSVGQLNVEHKSFDGGDFPNVSTPNTKPDLEKATVHTTQPHSFVANTTATGALNAPSLRLRPLLPSDEASIRAIWLEGWEDTLVQLAPVMWRERVRKARVTVATIAAAAALCYAAANLLLLARLPAFLLGLPQCFTSIFSVGSFEILVHVAALASHAIATISKWQLVAVAVTAVLLVAGPGVTPLHLQLAILRFELRQKIRRMCPDMWALYRSWSRPADGREYWIAELLPEGRVVGGVAIKMGSSLRPLAPLTEVEIVNGGIANVDVAQQVHQSCGSSGGGGVGGSGGASQLLKLPPENEAGFTEFDVKGHGPLESTDALVYRMVTHKEMRRCGIGRRLMELLMARAAAAGVQRLFLVTANAVAVAFYERTCGFEARPGAYGYALKLWIGCSKVLR